MKEKINQLVDKYQKTLSDSSSKTLKLMKMKAFKNTVEEFKSVDNQKDLHNLLLKPSNNSDSKLVSEVLFRVLFQDDFKKISDNMKHEEFLKFHQETNLTHVDYFFDIANHTLEKETMGNNSVEESPDFYSN